MTITDAAILIPDGLALLVGAAAGTLFYGGLWWTVCRGVASGQPGLWFMVSFLARMAVAALAILLVAQGRPDRLALCLLSFCCARTIIVRRLLPRTAQTGGREHAPQSG
jgi:F1F0 ATPase subunit 2